MFFSFWRGLWNRHRVPSGGGRHHSCQPRLETLEDRTLPAVWGGAILAPIPGPVVGVRPAGSRPPGGTSQICVTVDQNARPTVIDLGAAFGGVSGLQHRDGLKLSILGNTNASLVSTNLSEAALTLTYARGESGTATITVCATDADGVSVKQTLLVTVRPLSPAGTVHVSPSPAGHALGR
jgi:hypothetical protein